ncbi:MAG: right-handed parallel beta-helix repeat-containing protein [Clostridia bacterium]|nr:right-handed parallel beta-helix repeat-containing protein [Clostridia bacterium]
MHNKVLKKLIGISVSMILMASCVLGVRAEVTGFKISGYLSPDFVFSQIEAPLVKAGFKMELSGIASKSCVTDENGYFEFVDVPKTTTPGVPSSTMPYTLTVSRPNYLTRTIKNVFLSGDLVLSTKDKPLDIWAGDLTVNGIQDGAINMSDIVELIQYYNSAEGDGKYNQNFDLNRDKAINMTDIMVIVMHFNRVSGDYPTVEIKPQNAIYCSTSTEIQNALTNAKPGDRIIVRPGTYTGKWINSAFFYSGNDGTPTGHITIESEDPANPAILQGLSTASGYVLYITGDYWEIKNIKITTGQKGIMLDNSNYSVIDGCEVFNVGHEGIHLRDGSSNNRVENCKVYDTGKLSQGFGEGIYVGSDNGKWATFNKACDNNIIKGCILGPNVSAEHVDIKEGTVGTVIENCTMDGTGISGQNYADSFIDAKGNNAVIRFNICYRKSNDIIVDAFQVHQQLDGWGVSNNFTGNTVYLDLAAPYVVNAPAGSAKASNNTRYPAGGNMYKGNVVYD